MIVLCFSYVVLHNTFYTSLATFAELLVRLLDKPVN